MKLVVCPHCKSHRIVTAKVPKDVVVVMPCPSCNELVVLFRKKAIAVDRDILESGTMDERKDHLSTIIAEFLEPGLMGLIGGDAESQEGEESESARDLDSTWLPPISQNEFEDFAKIQLERLDDAAYFKKHFG